MFSGTNNNEEIGPGTQVEVVQENVKNGARSASFLDLSPDFLPVETILKEDEGNLLILSKNKIYNASQPNKKELCAKLSDEQRELQNCRMRVKRQNTVYKQWENEWHRNKMRALRSDPKFKEKEKLKERERMRVKRMNPQYREIERHKQDMRRRRKKIDLQLQAALQFDFQSSSIPPLQATSNQLDCISRDVNLWVASQLPSKKGENEFGFFIHSDSLSSSPPVLGNNEIQAPLNTKIPEKSKIVLKSVKAVPETNLNSTFETGDKFIITNDTRKIDFKLTDNNSSPLIVFGQSKSTHTSKAKEINLASFIPCDEVQKIECDTLDFRCEICDKSYESKANLTRHIKSHYAKFSCSMCDKEFHMKQHLNEHVKIHGEKKFSCDKCQYKTCYKYALNRHKDTKHKCLRK